MRACLLCGLLVVIGCGTDDANFGETGSGGSTNATSSRSATTGSTTGNGGAGGETGSGGAGNACTWSPDSKPCGEGFYCNAPDCMNGTCEELAENDDPVKEAVCGCDGVNYWNAHTAAAHGMPVASTGECAQPEACTPSTGNTKPCPLERHHCAQLVSSQAECVVDPSITSGVCWGMPEDCPPVAIGGTWRPCANEPCVDECTAIMGKRKYFPDLTCPQ